MLILKRRIKGTVGLFCFYALAAMFMFYVWLYAPDTFEIDPPGTHDWQAEAESIGLKVTE